MWTFVKPAGVRLNVSLLLPRKFLTNWLFRAFLFFGLRPGIRFEHPISLQISVISLVLGPISFLLSQVRATSH